MHVDRQIDKFSLTLLLILQKTKSFKNSKKNQTKNIIKKGFQKLQKICFRKSWIFFIYQNTIFLMTLGSIKTTCSRGKIRVNWRVILLSPNPIAGFKLNLLLKSESHLRSSINKQFRSLIRLRLENFRSSDIFLSPCCFISHAWIVTIQVMMPPRRVSLRHWSTMPHHVTNHNDE